MRSAIKKMKAREIVKILKAEMKERCDHEYDQIIYDDDDNPSGEIACIHCGDLIRSICTRCRGNSPSYEEVAREGGGPVCDVCGGTGMAEAQARAAMNRIDQVLDEDNSHHYDKPLLVEHFKKHLDRVVDHTGRLIPHNGPSTPKVFYDLADAGYVYAPYIPLQMTPTFLDPEDTNKPAEPFSSQHDRKSTSQHDQEHADAMQFLADFWGSHPFQLTNRHYEIMVPLAMIEFYRRVNGTWDWLLPASNAYGEDHETLKSACESAWQTLQGFYESLRSHVEGSENE